MLGEAAGEGGKIDHRPLPPGHALQAGQGAHVKAELGVIVVLDDVPPRRGGGPVQQLGAPAHRHHRPGGELVAGGHIHQPRPRRRQSVRVQPLFIHRHRHAADAVVVQNAPGAGVAGVFQRGDGTAHHPRQQAHQILHARAHHDLVGGAVHPAPGPQMPGDGRPQLLVAPALAVGQQAGAAVEQLLLDARPGAEGEKAGVHPAGGEVEGPRPRGGGRPGGARVRGGGRRGQGPLVGPHVIARPGPRLQPALRRQHLISPVHRVHAHPQLPRQGALAGHLFPRGQLAGAYLGRHRPVELLVERAVLFRREGDLKHAFCPLFLKLTP